MFVLPGVARIALAVAVVANVGVDLLIRELGEIGFRVVGSIGADDSSGRAPGFGGVTPGLTTTPRRSVVTARRVASRNPQGISRGSDPGGRANPCPL